MSTTRAIVPQNAFLRPKELLRSVGVDRDMIVADLGMGSGYFSLAASELVGPYGTVYAVDVNASALSHLKSRIQLTGQRNITPVWADIEQLGSTNIPDASCDVVLLVKVLYQVKQRAQALAEAVRVLKPRGTLLVVEWRMANTPIGPDVQKRLHLQTLEQELVARQLKVIDRPEVDEQHSVLVLTKEPERSTRGE